MRLGEALDILYGELVNIPCISAFNGVTQNIDNIESGNLFFLLHSSDLEEALNRGVYGIVFEGDLTIKDKEIAWIKVANIRQSFKRIVRYMLLKSQYSLVFLTPIELSLAKSLNLPILGECVKEDILHKLFRLYKESTQDKDSIEPFSKVLYTSRRDIEDIDIYKCYSLQYARQEIKSSDSEFNMQVPLHYKKTINVVSYSLFESKIIFNNKKEILPLPYIFLPFVESLYATLLFLQDKHSSLDTQGELKSQVLKNIDISHLNLQELALYFIDSNAKFSNTAREKSILFCQNLSIFECKTLQEQDLQYTTGIKNNAKIIFNTDEYCKHTNLLTKYLKLHASHLKLLSCYPKNIKLPRTTQKNIMLPYPHLTHLCQILLKTTYHLAIVYGISRRAFDKTRLMPRQDKNQNHKSASFQPKNNNLQRNIFEVYNINI